MQARTCQPRGNQQGYVCDQVPAVQPKRCYLDCSFYDGRHMIADASSPNGRVITRCQPVGCHGII